MIRPIDTQILYPNTPEMSNRQQVDHQKPNVQQYQFAELMQKEQTKKNESIVQMEEGQKIRNATDQNKKKQEHHGSKGKKATKAEVNKKTHLPENDSESRFDIRI